MKSIIAIFAFAFASSAWANVVSMKAIVLVNAATSASLEGGINLDTLTAGDSKCEKPASGLHFRTFDSGSPATLTFGSQGYILQTVQVVSDSETCSPHRAVSLHLKYANARAPQATLIVNYDVLNKTVSSVFFRTQKGAPLTEMLVLSGTASSR